MALFSERYSSNTRHAHRCTIADVLHLREVTLATRLHLVFSPPTPPGGQRFAFGSGFATHPHARACCETSPATGPPSHRSSLCMFCADTHALPMLALCQSVLQCPPVSESQSLQRHPALLSALTVGSSPMSPGSPFPAPPSTARCQPCHAAHLASPSAIPPVALHRCISGPVRLAPE